MRPTIELRLERKERNNPLLAGRVEAEYQARVDAMPPKERVARAAAMFQWMRDTIGRQLRRERIAQGGVMSDDELKWRIALRLYGGDPTVAALIQRRLDDVSG